MRKKWIGMVALLIGLMLCGAGVFAAGGITKDSGVVFRPPFLAIEGAGTLSESIKYQLENLYGTGNYTGDRVYSNGSEQIISVYRDGSKIGWHLVDAEGVIALYDQENYEYVFVRKSVREKVNAPLLKRIDEASDELIPVYVWLKDIDTEEVISTIPEEMAVNGRSATSDSEQAYIMQKREILSEAYSDYNNSFLNSVLASKNEMQMNTSYMFEENTVDQKSDSDVFGFASAYAPLCLLELSASQILELTEDERVAEIGLIPESEVVSYATSGGLLCKGPMSEIQMDIPERVQL